MSASALKDGKRAQCEKEVLLRKLEGMEERLRVLEAANGTLAAENKKLKAENGKLGGLNSKLTAQVSRDFENSSIPSSAKPIHKKICNSRVVTGRKRGGQPGHAFHPRKSPGAATRIVEMPAPEGAVSDPDLYRTGKVIMKQVVDVSMSVTVTEYRADEYRSRVTGARTHAAFPPGVCDEVSYGPGVKALLFMLTVCCNVPIAKAMQMVSDMTGGAVAPSQAMISGLAGEFSKKTKKEQGAIFASLQASPVLYTDATVSRINGKDWNVFVCTNKGDTLYFLRGQKGKEGVKKTPVEKEYKANPPSKYIRDGFNLQKRMRRFRDEHLRFLRHPEVDATNNISERLLRGFKRKQIQAVDFKSSKSVENICAAFGILKTARAKGDNIHEKVFSVFLSPMPKENPTV